MKKTFLAILAISAIVASCNSEKPDQKELTDSRSNRAVKASILENSETFVLHEKYRGDEKFAELSSIYYSSGDIPAKKSKAKLLRLAAEKVDRATNETIATITDVKKRLLKKAGCKNCVSTVQGDIQASNVDISKLKTSSASVIDSDELSNVLFSYAKEVSGLVASSQVSAHPNGEVEYNEEYFFELKEIGGSGPLEAKIDKQLKANSVSPDDKYTIQDILVILLQNDFPAESISTIDAITYLTIIERRILTARAHALSAIRYRIAG